MLRTILHRMHDGTRIASARIAIGARDGCGQALSSLKLRVQEPSPPAGLCARSLTSLCTTVSPVKVKDPINASMHAGRRPAITFATRDLTSSPLTAPAHATVPPSVQGPWAVSWPRLTGLANRGFSAIPPSVPPEPVRVCVRAGVRAGYYVWGSAMDGSLRSWSIAALIGPTNPMRVLCGSPCPSTVDPSRRSRGFDLSSRVDRLMPAAVS